MKTLTDDIVVVLLATCLISQNRSLLAIFFILLLELYSDTLHNFQWATSTATTKTVGVLHKHLRLQNKWQKFSTLLLTLYFLSD